MIDRSCSIPSSADAENPLFSTIGCTPRDCLFFDIETTGFRAASSSLYLIGFAYQGRDGWILRQLLAENPSEETQLLAVFAQVIRPFSVLVHFNGDRFDIPYLEEKYVHYGLPSPFAGRVSTDMYKDLRPLKKQLGLTHMNQKSLEAWLGNIREDQYDGGQLIQVYRNYVRSRDPQLLELLLLHNREDVAGMLRLPALYSYLYAFGFRSLQDADHSDAVSAAAEHGQDAAVSCRADGNSLVLERRAAFCVPKPVTLSHMEVTLGVQEDRISLRVPVCAGRLYHYFSQYREYYYLPEEDQAIHKSVAAFVGKEHRKPATPETCYIRKEDVFLAIPPSSKASPLFRRSFTDTLRWIPLPGEEALLRQCMQEWIAYICGE